MQSNGLLLAPSFEGHKILPCVCRDTNCVLSHMESVSKHIEYIIWVIS